MKEKAYYIEKGKTPLIKQTLENSHSEMKAESIFEKGQIVSIELLDQNDDEISIDEILDNMQ